MRNAWQFHDTRDKEGQKLETRVNSYIIIIIINILFCTRHNNAVPQMYTRTRTQTHFFFCFSDREVYYYNPYVWRYNAPRQSHATCYLVSVYILYFTSRDCWRVWRRRRRIHKSNATASQRLLSHAARTPAVNWAPSRRNAPAERCERHPSDENEQYFWATVLFLHCFFLLKRKNKINYVLTFFFVFVFIVELFDDNNNKTNGAFRVQFDNYIFLRKKFYIPQWCAISIICRSFFLSL